MPPDVLKRREGSFGSYLARRNEVLPQPPTYIEKLNQLRSQQRTAINRKPLPPLSPEKVPSCTPPAAPASSAPHSDVDLREMVRVLTTPRTAPPRTGSAWICLAFTGGVRGAGGYQQRKLKLEIARRAKAKGFQPKRQANIGPAVNLPLEKHMPPGEWTAQTPYALAATAECTAVLMSASVGAVLYRLPTTLLDAPRSE
jgi:hypothetical protein